MSLTIQDIAVVSVAQPTLWLTALAQRLGSTRQTVLSQSADLLGYPLMELDVMVTLVPDFDAGEYAQMLARMALIARDQDGKRCAVIGQPFLPSLGAWLAALDVVTVHMADPQVLHQQIESHEASFCAVADAVGEEVIAVLQRETNDELTLTSIQGEASPAVKLINSRPSLMHCGWKRATSILNPCRRGC